MNVTNALLVAILFVLLEQFHPQLAEALFSLGLVAVAIYVGRWLIVVYPPQRKQRKAIRQQNELLDRQFWECQAKRDAIRAKYDPKNEWNEGTLNIPRAYYEEIKKVNLEYRDMLERRNGWTEADFKK